MSIVVPYSQFCERLKAIHGDKIKPIGNYKNLTTLMKFKCCIKSCRNEWITTPSHIISKNPTGCPRCARVLVGYKKTKSDEQYKQEVYEKHNGLIKVYGTYKNNETKLEHGCEVCGFIWPCVPSSILMGTGCPKCAGKYVTHEDYVKKVRLKHGTFIKVKGRYEGAHSKIEHECLNGHINYITPTDILKGTGCKNCSFNFLKTQEQYTKDVFAVHGDSVKVVEEYKGRHAKIAHQCTKCEKILYVAPNDILKGNGCRNCSKKKKFSTVSLKWLASLEKQIKLKIQTEINGGEFKIKSVNGYYSADGYNRHFNIIFEFHGDYYHGHKSQRYKKEWRNRYKRTLKKTNYLLKIGYPIVYIWESDYKAGLPPTCLLTKENAHYKEWAESHGFIVRIIERAVRCI